MNAEHHADFLAYSIGLPRSAGEEPSLLQRALWILLTSKQMMAQCCLLSIHYMAIILPWRWLCGKTHTLGKDYEWGAVSIGRVLDLVRTAMLHLKEHPRLILSEVYMMNILGPLMQELPPLLEYHEHLYKGKTTRLVNKASGTKVMQMCRLREEVFHPRIKTNQDTT